MVASRSASGVERRRAVADFAGKLFGTSIAEANVIGEYLVPVSLVNGQPTGPQLQKSVIAALPQDAGELLREPLTAWVETTVGIEKDAEGVYRRKVPQSLNTMARSLAEAANVDAANCSQKLRETLLAGSSIKPEGGSAAFAFNLHQFISQGRPVYGTVEDRALRFLTLGRAVLRTSARRLKHAASFVSCGFLSRVRPGVLQSCLRRLP